MLDTFERKTKVLLVGLDIGQDADFDKSMDELKSLTEAALKEVVGIITQKMPDVNKTWYIGSGKVSEVKEFAFECEADEVIFNDTLTPAQLKNLTESIDKAVSDRTKLILDIFALRAKTREAKLQVETARLQYMLPRLVGMHAALSRQGGGSGSLSNKGSGETQLELDRRRIEKRISELRHELEDLSKVRENQRKKRDGSNVPQVALVGYTNAGKSTVMNHIVSRVSSDEQKSVFEKDMLFATLETSIRNIDTNDKRPFFLADTVGFINKLPTALVKAFRSTLMEVKYADLLLHVVDFSDEGYKEHMRVTNETLKDIDALGIPQIIVYNKIDKCSAQDSIEIPKIVNNSIYLCAGLDKGIDELIDLIKDNVYKDRSKAEFVFDYNNSKLSSMLMENTQVLSTEYLNEGIRIVAMCDEKNRARFKDFIVNK